MTCRNCCDYEDEDDYGYDDDDGNLDRFSDEAIKDEYVSRFWDDFQLAEEIHSDINMSKDVSDKLRTLIQNMTGKLVLNDIKTK